MAVKKDKKTGKWMFWGKLYCEGKVVHSYTKRGFAKKKDAVQAELEYREAYLKENNKIRFQDLYDQFLPFWKTQVKETTVITENGLYQKLFKDFDGCDLMDHKVLQSIISDYDQKYSKKYVERVYLCFNRVFNWATRNDLIESNPMRKVYKSTRVDEKKKEMLFFEPKDFENFISVVDDPKYKAAFSCLYWMGIRRGEMFALQWKDIDFKRRTISITKTVSTLKRNSEDPFNTPKTTNSYRTISMPKCFFDELSSWYQTCSKFACFGPSMFVFGDDKPMPTENLRRHLKMYIKEANIRGFDLPNIRVHDFRHSHASYLINNMSSGFTDFDIAKRLGDTVETIHSVYAHWFKAGDDKIINFMDSDNL